MSVKYQWKTERLHTKIRIDFVVVDQALVSLLSVKANHQLKLITVKQENISPFNTTTKFMKHSRPPELGLNEELVA